MANIPATQEANPARATWRTILQVGLPALLTFVLILPDLLQLVLDQVGGVLPEGFRLWLTGAVVVVTAFAGLLARLMANPALNDWFRKHLRLFAPDHQRVTDQNPAVHDPAVPDPAPGTTRTDDLPPGLDRVDGPDHRAE